MPECKICGEEHDFLDASGFCSESCLETGIENLEQAEQDHRRLVSEVRRMRELQRAYFKTRDRDVLIESKKAEKLVDELVG